MKVIQVKKVPKRATKYAIDGGFHYVLKSNKCVFHYDPYTNIYGEHVFVRYTYPIK